MLHKIKNRKQEGFTIIEVLIVLAIAGLILLIVFLAVPALQRNAHNTTKKNDIASLLGGMTEYVNNNNGTLPPVAAAGSMGSGNSVTIGTGTNSVNVKIGNYTADKVAIAASIQTFPDVNSVVIVEGATCNGNVATTSGATSRNFAAEFTLEGGAQQCSAS